MDKQAKVIAVCNQKGGSTKSTICGAIAHILGEIGNKVLVCDLDSQGNVSSLLLGKDVDEFYQRTLFDAMVKGNTDGFIYTANNNIDVLTADDHTATFPRWLYTSYKGNVNLVLKHTLEPLKSKYDYIIIDTPPALGDHTINALAFSDGVIISFVPEEYCYTAVGRFLTTAKIAQQKNNPNLKILGILCGRIDYRRSDHKAYLKEARELYKGFMFNTEIKERATTGRLSSYGFINNPELDSAIELYKIFVQELLQRGI